VIALRAAPVSVFFVVTVAAGTGAPDGSVTMPLMLAETWARADGKQVSIKKSVGNVRRYRAQLDRLAGHRLSAREFGLNTNKQFKVILKSPRNTEDRPGGGQVTPYRPAVTR
jgi:hypothetical protein